MFSFCITDCIVILAPRVTDIGFSPNLMSLSLCIADFFKMIFPTTHSTCLASCWALGIMSKLNIQSNQIYNISYLSLGITLVCYCSDCYLAQWILSDSSPSTKSAASWVPIFSHCKAICRVCVIASVLGLLQAIFV